MERARNEVAVLRDVVMTDDGLFAAVGDSGVLQTSRRGDEWTRGPLVIGPRIDPAPAPNVLHLQTGDDVRRAFGSSYEGLAQMVDRNRAQPIAMLRIDEG